ncbi:MAG: SRPBCC domain-containing protein [Pseudomonadota bacterium]
MTITDGAIVSTLHAIRFERHYATPVEVLWAAISDQSQVAVWMEYPTRLEPVAGGQVLIDFAPEDPLEGIVSAAEPNRLLAYTWGESLIKWELAADEKGSRLVFSHFGVRSEFLTGLCAGWQCFLDNLAAHLAGKPFVDRFEELHRQYKRELDL